MQGSDLPDEWKTKPTDRFILRWIKCHLSVRITPRLTRFTWLRPWMITLLSSFLGMIAGVFFAVGWGFAAGLIAMVSQVLDGVDGQFSRLTGRQSPQGALFDSSLDRYADTALVLGLCIYLIRLPCFLPLWQLLVLGFLALAGSSSISYTTARAETLGLAIEEKPTLASKGTRTTVIAFGGLVSFFWAQAPVLALIYLAVHTNWIIAQRLLQAFRKT